MEFQLFVGGAFRDGVDVRDVRVPYDGTVFARVHIGDPALLGEAVAAARKGLFVMRGLTRARRAEIFAALKNEILPRVAHGGTLYLIVGDHGELSRGAVKESQITLWQMAPAAGAKSAATWRTDTKEVLTVTESNIERAIALYATMAKTIAEGAGAVPLAALLLISTATCSILQVHGR